MRNWNRDVGGRWRCPGGRASGDVSARRTFPRASSTRVLSVLLAVGVLIAMLVACESPATPEPPDTAPSFGRQTVSDQTYTAGVPISALVLPAATGGTSPLTYSLTPTVPGLQFAAASRTLQGTPSSAGKHSMTYRVVDADGDVARLTFTVQVNFAPVADTRPSFDAQTVPDQTYTVGVHIGVLELPRASGGNPPLTATLTPEVPGLMFLPFLPALSGTPTAAAVGGHAMTYRVEDDDGDFATLRFDVRVNPAPTVDTRPSFGTQTVSDHTFWVGSSIVPLVLPEAGGGNPPLSYGLTPKVPGLWFNPITRIVGGTPTAAAEGTHAMTYRVEDDDGDFATLRFDVRVNPAPVADTRPSFGAQTVPDQMYKVGATISRLVLPKATGGNAPLRYSLTPDVPGLSFSASTRALYGTPTEEAEGDHTMVYRVEDTDGDAATLRFDVRVKPRFRFVPVPAAPQCLQIEPGEDTDTGTNICTQRISVFYCFVQEQRGCGSNTRERQPYYTHFSFAFGEPGSTTRFFHRGMEWHYAVCQGDINPFTVGEFVSDAEGNYSCFNRVRT